MKQYFLKLDLNQPKNKAQKAVQEFAKQYADCLIDEPALKKLKLKIEKELQRINTEHPRCTDLSFTVSEHWIDEFEHQINIDGGIYFSYRSVKRFELSENRPRPCV